MSQNFAGLWRRIVRVRQKKCKKDVKTGRILWDLEQLELAKSYAGQKKISVTATASIHFEFSAQPITAEPKSQTYTRDFAQRSTFKQDNNPLSTTFVKKAPFFGANLA